MRRPSARRTRGPTTASPPPRLPESGNRRPGRSDVPVSAAAIAPRHVRTRGRPPPSPLRPAVRLVRRRSESGALAGRTSGRKGLGAAVLRTEPPLRASPRGTPPHLLRGARYCHGVGRPSRPRGSPPFGKGSPDTGGTRRVRAVLFAPGAAAISVFPACALPHHSPLRHPVAGPQAVAGPARPRAAPCPRLRSARGGTAAGCGPSFHARASLTRGRETTAGTPGRRAPASPPRIGALFGAFPPRLPANAGARGVSPSFRACGMMGGQAGGRSGTAQRWNACARPRHARTYW
ncbi:hypothetical protein EKD16_02425 [Streptomonospora litoralis]|uniref:Uncharacterized protein n=1 Tax=Streptomonospora litoralis TaxID=2498135 RepID=A0A4P6PZG3_9ACTN|nr:hypothetical protein EKD16_02425 [Streptomonospora litoralis]